jgi:hypothetical protein
MADRLLQSAQLRKDPLKADRFHLNGDMHGLDIGDELIHLRKCLAMSKVSMGGPDRLFLNAVAGLLEQPPRSKRAGALDSATDLFLQALDRYPGSNELRLARGAALQIRHSWQRWCESQEDVNGLT